MIKGEFVANLLLSEVIDMEESIEDFYWVHSAEGLGGPFFCVKKGCLSAWCLLKLMVKNIRGYLILLPNQNNFRLYFRCCM